MAGRVLVFLGMLAVLSERTKLALVHAHRHLSHEQPTGFDRPEERLAAQQAVVSLRVLHVPVGGSEGW